jgi:hypothetical protein
MPVRRLNPCDEIVQQMLVILKLLDLRFEATDLGVMRFLAPQVERWVERTFGACAPARIARRFRWIARTTALSATCQSGRKEATKEVGGSCLPSHFSFSGLARLAGHGGLFQALDTRG